MAGIGFRLKRLIAEETYAGWLRAHLYGAVISSGPWLLSVCTLAALAALSHSIVAGAEQQVFRGIVVYTYTFSLVTTGAAQMVVTRVLADELFRGRFGALPVLFHRGIAATAVVHALLASVFYALAPGLALEVRILGVALFVVVSCTWMAMIFVGAAQDYASVVAAFLAGSVVSFAAALALGRRWGLPAYLGGFVLGQAVIFFALAARVEREFPDVGGTDTLGLLRALGRYPALALAGFAYNAAIAVDRFAFWASPLGTPIASWFYASPYDGPVFIAYVSIVPTLALFLVSMETDFYERYRAYYGVVIKHGTLRQVLAAKEAMAASLRANLRRVFIVQVPITLGAMLGAPWLAATLGMDRVQASILRAVLVGALLHTLALLGGIVLLYFDRRRAALEVAAAFLGGNLVLTLVSLALGPRFYGHGYALAALVACLVAYGHIERTLHNLEYLTFASQPMVLPAEAPA